MSNENPNRVSLYHENFLHRKLSEAAAAFVVAGNQALVVGSYQVIVSRATGTET